MGCPPEAVNVKEMGLNLGTSDYNTTQKHPHFTPLDFILDFWLLVLSDSKLCHSSQFLWGSLTEAIIIKKQPNTKYLMKKNGYNYDTVCKK